jgi:hypothetical protein
MSQESAPLRAFFQVTLGQGYGYVCIATSPDLKAWKEEYFAWPTQYEAMWKYIEFYRPTHNVYFCPQLLETKKRNKDNVKACPNIWADLDTCTPDRLLVEPTVTVESSPGRYQAVWALSEEHPPTDVWQ